MDNKENKQLTIIELHGILEKMIIAGNGHLLVEHITDCRTEAEIRENDVEIIDGILIIGYI